MNFVAIDFETANFARDSACSIGLVRVKNGKIVEKTVHLIQPPTKQFTFTYIHGLKWADVAGAPTFGELWPKISSFFEGVDFLVAHNSSFDEGVLKALCLKYKLKAPSIPFQCTVKIAKSRWKLKPAKLSDVCKHLDIPLNHHEALSDAMACAQIMIKSKENKV